MREKFAEKFQFILFRVFPLTAVVVGSLLLIVYHFIQGDTMPIKAALFADMVTIPLDFFDLKVDQYVLETENYLLFQQFESLPPLVRSSYSLVFGVVLFLLVSLGLVLVSFFDRTPFGFSMVAIIFLLTLTGVNSLHIGGLNTNLPMMLLMAGMVLPTVVLHTFYHRWNAFKRMLLVFPLGLLTVFILIQGAGAVSPGLLMAENITMFGLAVAAIFLVYTGHAVLSSVFILLVKLNKGVGLKISWHLTLLFLAYLGVLIFIFLTLTGHAMPGIGTAPIPFLLLGAGVLGYFETKNKIRQVDQPFRYSWVGEGLYLTGFAITVWVYWKAEFSLNRPLMDFMNHLFIYSQIAFCLLFFVYLMANFSGLMNAGIAVDKIIFKPKFFAYYHMRIGAVLAMLSLIVFSDGIVGVQFSTASTNVSADYYYATGRPKEAQILYENSWERYRRNEKAINAVAHLALAQNQPSAAINTLFRALEYSPSVNDILLLSSALSRSGKDQEALAVLERGIEFFPDDAYILNNQALRLSGNNQGMKAFQMVEDIEGEKDITMANKIGLQAKHLIYFDTAFDAGSNAIAHVNQLAIKNLKGERAVFFKELEEEHNKNDLLTRAMLRNQWSNEAAGEIAEDLALIDTLLARTQVPSIAAELRETRVIRTLRQDFINESLKHLNGLAFQFPNSAGFFHSMAAKILVGQLDLEKAAVEFSQAEAKGFRNFKSKHLPVLFFGGQEAKSFEIADRYKLDFPDWMRFTSDGSLITNDTTRFFSEIASLPTAVKTGFLSGLEEIKNPDFRSFLALQILTRKGHWLEGGEIERLADLAEAGADKEKPEYLEGVTKALMQKNLDPDRETGEGFLDVGVSLDRNAYWTPLVFLAVEEAEDDLRKYNILLEASDFNKDPLLWIHLVKYSRLIGVDSYASSLLNKMMGWVDAKTLEELQIKSLNDL